MIQKTKIPPLLHSFIDRVLFLLIGYMIASAIHSLGRPYGMLYRTMSFAGFAFISTMVFFFFGRGGPLLRKRPIIVIWAIMQIFCFGAALALRPAYTIETAKQTIEADPRCAKGVVVHEDFILSGYIVNDAYVFGYQEAGEKQAEIYFSPQSGEYILYDYAGD